MSASFAHLHTHSDCSLLDGLSLPSDLAVAAARDGQPALAITDHGNLYGAIDLVKACEKVGIKPIVGMEAYFSIAGAAALPVPAAAKERFHLVLLAVSPIGFKNLARLSSRAFLEGFSGKPCVTLDMLDGATEGIVATTACLGGIVPQLLLAGDESGARQWAGRFAEIFRAGNLFIEIQDHGQPDDILVTKKLVALSKEMHLPLVATNDSHYTLPGDADVHDAWLCVQTNATLAEEGRFRFEGEGYYLKPAAEMRRLFAEVPEACDNTLLIAERVETALPFSEPRLPRFETPNGEPEATYLRQLVNEGAHDRYGDTIPAAVVERLDYELGVIERMGFPGYFLIVWDIYRFAHSAGVACGPGRGSAAGCLALYCLRVTDLDPLVYGLSFDLFLNPDRASMPDIDMDFDDDGRGLIFEYTINKYGRDCVSQIATFSTLHARNAVRDACRVLGLPYALGDKISKAMPPVTMGHSTPLAACMELTTGHESGYAEATPLREFVGSEPDARRVIDLAVRLEGVRRTASSHAAGVVISDAPLIDIIPLQRQPGDKEKRDERLVGLPVTQYDLSGAEQFGLVKFDFLGLRTMGVLANAVRMVREGGEPCPDYDKLPLDDPATYELLRTGKTIGVFQLESPPMQSLLRELRPDRLSDVTALVALYRPGPMAANMHHEYAKRKNGIAPPTAPHPDMLELFSETYGLMVFQEQLVALCRHYAGMTASESDAVRKAAGKKIRAAMAAQEEKFIQGCLANGRSAALAQTLWSLIPPFADYAFRKSHALCYAVLAVRSAYLKTHYPAEFWAAQLASVSKEFDAMARYLAAAQDENMVVLGPDVAASGVNFAAEDTGNDRAVRFGLRGIKGVGDELAAAIVGERERGGSFQGPEDFCKRLGTVVQADSAMALVDAGAFDRFGPRRSLLTRIETTCKVGRDLAKKEAHGMIALFDDETMFAVSDLPPVGGTSDTPDTPDAPEDARWMLAAERRALGVYLSGHPLEQWRDLMVQRNVLDAGAVTSAELFNGASVTCFGVVTDFEVKISRAGKPYGRGILDGRAGRIGIVAFGEIAVALGQADGEGRVVSGRLEDDEGNAQVICFRAEPMPTLAEVSTVVAGGERDGGDGEPVGLTAVVVRVVDDVGAEALAMLRAAICSVPGGDEVFLQIGARRFRLGDSFTVDSSRAVAHLAEQGFSVETVSWTPLI